MQEFIVPGGEGKAFHVKEGESVTITDLEGKQVIDFIAFNESDKREYLSVSQTRTGTGPQGNLYVQEGTKFLTNLRNLIAEIIKDTVKVHDLMIAACDPAYYRDVGYLNHKSCHQNFVDVLAPYGIKWWQLPDPFNIFQNTKIQPDGTWVEGDPPSNAGDYITMRFHMDALCAVSACPYDLDGFNAGKPTPIKVKVN